MQLNKIYMKLIIKAINNIIINVSKFFKQKKCYFLKY